MEKNTHCPELEQTSDIGNSPLIIHMAELRLMYPDETERLNEIQNVLIESTETAPGLWRNTTNSWHMAELKNEAGEPMAELVVMQPYDNGFNAWGRYRTAVFRVGSFEQAQLHYKQEWQAALMVAMPRAINMHDIVRKLINKDGYEKFSYYKTYVSFPINTNGRV